MGPTPEEISEIAKKIAYAKIVMLGESSHGTQEYYEWRRLISQELISKHGFNFISVEGDWPACSEVNHFVTSSRNGNSRYALKDFRRWPTWMWANTAVEDLVTWMKEYNLTEGLETPAGFYGLDVYSLFESIDQVLKILSKVDPAMAIEARKQYLCFDRFQKNEKKYAKSLYFSDSCEEEVLRVLQILLRARGPDWERDRLFDAQQNARIVKNAEDYYRAMIRGNDDSWNIRDAHMMETLNLLLEKYGSHSKGIVWAHNTHIGDYRATTMVDDGQINIGGLAREEWGEDKVALLGFGTYEGTVIASRAWDGPTEVMPVPEGQPETYEALFHSLCLESGNDHIFQWLQDQRHDKTFAERRGHRAIGVVYNPAHERYGNYVPTSLANRYDGFVFIDRTNALTPLAQKEDRKEFPEAWPGGF